MPYATNDGVAYGRRHQAADVVAVQNDLEIDAARFSSHFMGGDVALALGRHHPDRVTAFVVTGYSPFAAAGEEAAETAAWATDLQGGMEGIVAGYERRHGTHPDDARARWLANDGAALTASVASMIAESDGSQVADPRDRNPGHVVGRNRGAICGAGASSAGVAPVRRVRFFGGASPHADVLPKRSRLAACSGISGSN